MAGILHVELSMRMASGFHVSGERLELWVDRTLCLDWGKGAFPMIPATSLKGWLREGTERLLRSLGISACDASTPTTVCGTCPVCRIFGHPRGKSPLQFENVVLRDAFRETRMSVSLSRYRKTAYEERLFSTEVGTAPGFTVPIRGLFPNDHEGKRAAALLFAASRVPFAIGGGKSRGLGWVTREAFSATLNGRLLSEEELFQELEALIQERGERS